MPDENSILCARCGLAQHLHRLANFSDGNQIGSTILICPTAVFDAEDGPHAHANRVSGEMKKKP